MSGAHDAALQQSAADAVCHLRHRFLFLPVRDHPPGWGFLHHQRRQGAAQRIQDHYLRPLHQWNGMPTRPDALESKAWRSLSRVSKGRCSLERVFLVLWCWFCILSPVCVPHLHPGSGLAGRFRLLRRACFPLLQHVVHLCNHEVPHSQHHQHRLHLCWCPPVR